MSNLLTAVINQLGFKCKNFSHTSMKKILLLSAIFLCIDEKAIAQATTATEMVGQPLFYMKDGATDGCGLRVVGILPSVPGMNTFRSFDVSANFWRSGAAVIKIIGDESEISNPNLLPNARRLPLVNGWLKAEGKMPAAPVEGTFKLSAGDAGAYLFPADLNASIDFILAASTNERVQVAIKWDDGVEMIYSGKVRLPEEEQIQIAQCLKEVVGQLLK